MKNILVLPMLVVLLGSGRASAGIVYDGGSITDGSSQANYPISGPWAVSDLFNVNGPVVLSGAQNIGIYVNAGAIPTSVQWSIGSAPFNSDIGSGTSIITSTLVRADTGSYDFYNASITLNGTVNDTQPNYWLTLQNATATPGGDVGWDRNDYNAGGILTAGYESIAVGSESFQLVGTATAVPEPSSFVLLGLTAIVGFICWLMCRRTKAVHSRAITG